ncbi:hypothetical protein TNCV_1007051 [Trichonephila clavipes]|nr:hypothetical protein TNCV_1007051 [Trichonephila clavipes]
MTVGSISILRLCVQKTTCFRSTTAPAEDCLPSLLVRRRKTTTVLQYVADHLLPFAVIREKNLCIFGEKTSLRCRSLCKMTSCVVHHNERQKMIRLLRAKKNTFPDPDSNGASIRFTNEF